MATPRRLVFGEVAELYDRHRPSYPSVLIDDLIEQAGVSASARVLEVGAGTGKATAMLAARGIKVVAIEPSAGMAEIAARRLAATGLVEIVRSDFERWDREGARFPLIFSAQAWHWLDPATRFPLARAALAPQGLLAAFWNRPVWVESALRAALRDAYEHVVPELPPDGPLHPANSWTADTDEDWETEELTAAGFAAASRALYPWSVEYSSAEYRGLLATLSEIRLLPEASRDRLLDAVRTAVEAHGGVIELPMTTILHTARAN
ncbi:MAG: class I SAM-dependent methyltransferase [Solirubrobacteraceae bacterium]